MNFWVFQFSIFFFCVYLAQCNLWLTQNRFRLQCANTRSENNIPSTFFFLGNNTGKKVTSEVKVKEKKFFRYFFFAIISSICNYRWGKSFFFFVVDHVNNKSNNDLKSLLSPFHNLQEYFLEVDPHFWVFCVLDILW